MKGAIYKRVNPQEEINAKAKDDFWRKQEVEEENRKKDEKGKVQRFSQNEVKLLRRESQEYFNEQERAASDTSSSLTTPISSPSPTPPVIPKTNGTNLNGLSTTTNGGGRASVSPTPPAFSNAFVATEKAAVLKASTPKKSSENLVRQRIKSFDGNPNESPSFQYLSSHTNGSGGSGGSSRNGDGSPEGESLSVLRRKQMFESGRVSNSASTLIRKDPAQEIKSLQEEAGLKKAAQVPPAAAVQPRATSPPRRTPSPQKPPPLSQNPNKSPLPPKSPSPQPPVTSPPPPQAQYINKSSQGVKANNLPFHIGGSVSQKLAEKINKNTDTENSLGKVENSNNSNNYSYEEPKTASPPLPQPTNINHSYSPTPTYEDRTIQSAEVPPTVVNEAVETVVAASPIPIEGTASPALEIKPEMGLCARALYDYQAGKKYISIF
jgi:hypothetical protein